MSILGFSSSLAGDDGLLQSITQVLGQSHLRGAPRLEARQLWDQVLQSLDYIPIVYSQGYLDYQLVYEGGQNEKCWDISMVLFHDDKPSGIWPVSFSVGGSQPAVSSLGLPLLPPLFVRSLARRSRKSLTSNCLDVSLELGRAVGLTEIHSAEPFAGDTDSGFSEWHKQSMRLGARAAVRHDLYVDLSREFGSISAAFRKSYRPLISSGLRTWQVGQLTSADDGTWDEFRALHLRVSGRVTRSPESWALQHQGIADGQAFLIYIRDQEGRMVGGGYFLLTRDEGAYSVGAYDRTLFDKPLGHVVQFRAIEEMKRRRLRWYRLGSRSYLGSAPAPTAKEISIAEFKQGFASHLFPQFELCHDLSDNDRS